MMGRLSGGGETKKSHERSSQIGHVYWNLVGTVTKYQYLDSFLVHASRKILDQLHWYNLQWPHSPLGSLILHFLLIKQKILMQKINVTASYSLKLSDIGFDDLYWEYHNLLVAILCFCHWISSVFWVHEVQRSLHLIPLQKQTRSQQRPSNLHLHSFSSKAYGPCISNLHLHNLTFLKSQGEQHNPTRSDVRLTGTFQRNSPFFF